MRASKGSAKAGAQRTDCGPRSGPLSLIHRNNCSNPIGMRVSGALVMPMGPWKEGLLAGGFSGVNCPYSAVSKEGWAWASGYIEGRAVNAKSTR
jgi:hypothetical protein